MDDNSENFIKLISSYFNNDTVRLCNPDWNGIFQIARIHDLCGMVYAKAKDTENCDKEILKKLEGAFISNIKYSVLQEAALQELVGLLNRNKIRHILFKGTVLKNYYPDKELRTMGDIDIVIDRENQEYANEILVENGFALDELSSHSAVRNYIKNGVCFEVHTQVVEKNVFDNVDYINYFSDNFKNAWLVKDYTYEFNYEYHFIYLMVHMAKHFKHSGCGVRMVLDIAFFVRRLCKEIDWAIIEKELIYLKLDKFSACIFELCKKWFSLEIPAFKIDMGQGEMSIVEQYIVDGGVFGYVGRNTDSIRINNSGENFVGKVKNMVNIVFPSYEALKSRYVKFQNMPKFMLPVGWIRLWWYRAVENKENSLKRIKSAFEDKSDAEKHNMLMRCVGLNTQKGRKNEK